MKSLVKKSVVACFSVCLSMASFHALAGDLSQDMSQHKHQDSAAMAGDNAMSHDAMSSENQSHAMNMMASDVLISGVVKGVLSETGQLKIQHQAIPEWSMGAMQMKFTLASGLSAADFSEGQQIKFRLHQENMTKYTITEILDK
ncbi:MAG: copper-binding protein [Amphritea sp.]